MKETNKQKPIDLVEEQMRSLREDNKETSKESINKRKDPEFVHEMYNGLKKEIDMINGKPENKKYLEEFKKTKKAYEKRGTKVIDLLKEGLQTLNLTAMTGKPKFDEKNKIRPVDYNNSDIDGRGVYVLLHELNLIKTSPEEEGLTTQYIQGNTNKVEEGVAINEKQIGENNGLEVRDEHKKTKARKFLENKENPFKNTIITVNNNIKDSDGPTSSTRMVYEILKEEGMIPKDRQQQIEKFVYFVDIAYRLKQRVVGMDYAYIHATIFGNYKSLNVFDIYDYFENPENTGFEPIYNKDAEQIKIYNGQIQGKTKIYTESDLLHTLKNKSNVIDSVIKNGYNKIKENVLYCTLENGVKQSFIFDIEGTSNFAEDLAAVLASEKLGFCKIHAKNNEIFIRSYYDLPKKFGPFVTESANTIHGKLTKDNIEEFLSILKGDNEIKEKIRAQFKKNGGIETQKLEVKVGERYTGTIKKKADFGIFIEIKKGDSTTSGLLHISQIKNGDIANYKEGSTIDVIVNSITPDKKIGFSLAPEKKSTAETIDFKKPQEKRMAIIEKMKIGRKFDAEIQNVNENNTIFVKIDDMDIVGILQTHFVKDMIKDMFPIGDKIKVKLIKKTDKGPIFEIL